jgi:hypothetical protein
VQKARSFPSWAPKPLSNVHRAIKMMDASKWIAPEGEFSTGLRSDSECEPIEILMGVGSMADTCNVIERLCTDPQMRGIWAKIERLETSRAADTSRRRSWHFEKFFSCSIARLCALVIAYKNPLTAAEWIKRHKAIARTARNLARLLGATDRINSELQKIATFITEEQLKGIAVELHFHLGSHNNRWYEPERIPDERHWAEGDAIYQHYLDRALNRIPIDSSGLLSRMADLADLNGMNTRRWPATLPELRIFVLIDNLAHHMLRNFEKPTHDIVATITSVVLNTEVSAESVKARANRRRIRSKRPLKKR